jgi:protein-L-isoaspartate O-methyltransferase
MTPDWLPALSAVDRSHFLPSRMWPFDMRTHTSISVGKAVDPDAWYGHADADEPITTQWDDGNHSGTAPGKVATSSSSMPSVVFSMLRDLDVRSGLKVLEIGTGTGWNAGLLAHRLGDANVTTVEVDQSVAAAARSALHRAGLRPAVVNSDGFPGHPGRAPFDRIIATVGLRSIPHAWVRQTVPGGLIVAPWGTHYANRDAVVRLTVDENGTASGHFTGPVEFMKLRAHRLARLPHAEYLPDGFPGDAETVTTTLTAHDGFGDRFHPFGFVAGLRVTRCAHASDARDSSRGVWFYSLSDKSWAAVLFQEEKATSTVHQSGPRRLWDEVEAAYRWWVDVGRPGVERFGLDVGPEGEYAWLDSPVNPVRASG